VAVKVQYPGIERTVETDLQNLSLLVRLLAKIEKNYDFRWLMDEVCKYTPRELDFVLEGQSAERVAKDLQHRVDIHIPAVLWEYTARRVLVTEFVQGIKISDIPRLLEAGIDPNQEIITYCSCGVRSALATVILSARGVPKVRNYDGSLAEWAADPALPMAK
jgi:predicted unusual protein kinase regulating ubiquinone biosynthesis (AarF/ABC1/UbiB family)